MSAIIKTNLVGGAIASTNPQNSTLTTDTLTLANLENKMSYSATSGSISGGVNSNTTGTTPSFNPGIPMHEEGGDTTITYATITDGTITVGGVTTNSAESLGAHTDLATAHTALEKLPDLKVLLADQQAMAAAASTVISASNQISNDIAGNAEKTKDNLKNEFGNTLSPEDQQIYNSLTPTQKESVLLNNADTTTIAAYNEAQTTISHWGVGGDYSRALGVVTNIIVGATAGQGTTQISTNAVAPYAAELIGNTFDHTDDPNKVAQLLSHAVLGGVLAYANGGNATSGALAGAGAEAASLAIAQELYPDAFDADGTFHRDRLSEGQANAILALSSAVGAFVGGVSGGGINDVVIDANVAENAVENNDLSFWNLSDLQRTKVLQNGSINDKIKSLVEAGLTKEQIKQSLANNADFKALTKDGDAKFDKVFVEQKTQVDATNTKIDNIVLALEAAGMATMFVDGATVKLSDIAVKKLVQEAITKGLDPSKISPEKIVSIAKVDGKIVWLEKGYQVGDKGAGLEHIIQEHADDFLRKGISKEEIPKFIMTTLSKGKIVEYQGTGTGRPVYEVIYKGVTRKVAITVGDNGFIVGANPR